MTYDLELIEREIRKVCWYEPRYENYFFISEIFYDYKFHVMELVQDLDKLIVFYIIIK
ncbi:MAG: hypothetical protein ACFFG0_23185 [Candidatus Thorarchaeota archaeon]